MTRADIRSNVQDNLKNAGVFFNDTDVNNSIQDAYFDVTSKTRCIIKTINLPWQSLHPYYDLITDCGVADYLSTWGVFNYVTNLWLRDDLGIRHFDDLRMDWEMWNAAPQYWAPHSLRRIAVAPNYAVATGNFKLCYSGICPLIVSDADQLLIATDMQVALEEYATADLLESNQEVTRAQAHWNIYFPLIDQYKKRVENIARFDYMPKI